MAMKPMTQVRFSNITKADVTPKRPLYCNNDLLSGGFCHQLSGSTGDVFVPRECISSKKPSFGDEQRDAEVMYLTYGDWYRENGDLKASNESAFLVFENGVCKDFSPQGNWQPNKLKNTFIRIGHLIGELFSSHEEDNYSPWGF